MTKNIKIKDKQDRKKLGEGRNWGVGFAFAKKEDDVYTTVQPISPCKDYLNDTVYGEYSKKTVNAYGLSYKPTGLFEEEKAYLVAKVVGFNNNVKEYPGNKLKEDSELFLNNAKNIEKLLNYIEDKLKIAKTIVKVVDDKLLFESDKYWASQTYLISLYSLLIRMAHIYDGKKSPENFLKTYGSGGSTNENWDVGLWKSAKKCYDYLLSGNKFKQTFDIPNPGTNVHNEGICSYVRKLS